MAVTAPTAEVRSATPGRSDYGLLTLARGIVNGLTPPNGSATATGTPLPAPAPKAPTTTTPPPSKAATTPAPGATTNDHEGGGH
jgi:hypothetical protein